MSFFEIILVRKEGTHDYFWTVSLPGGTAGEATSGYKLVWPRRQPRILWCINECSTAGTGVDPQSSNHPDRGALQVSGHHRFNWLHWNCNKISLLNLELQLHITIKVWYQRNHQLQCSLSCNLRVNACTKAYIFEWWTEVNVMYMFQIQPRCFDNLNNRYFYYELLDPCSWYPYSKCPGWAMSSNTLTHGN